MMVTWPNNGAPRTRRMAAFNESVLRCVLQEQSVRSRAVGCSVSVGNSTVLRVLHENLIHAYHLRKVHVLCDRVYVYCEFFLRESNARLNFPSTVLLIHEA
ncbi:hypothetical protein PR048_011145 [Dryococelus australis]|uniref:Transposase n=1 Tax=Dryococelus australis TaxID=614101 RepID=A0ABQ9HLB8_9NEOP|nr:hypothetical protein PR048_011145 [Dryococelus australis]